MQPRLAIIADDLTGGLDTGVAFAERGWRTVLRFAPRHALPDMPHVCDAEVIVWDTETREADEETARQTIRAVCALPSVREAPRLYKKIDSTLRGPWLAELREAWKARASLTTVLCPAFPAVGRTVEEEEVRVHGRPLAEAGFAGTGRLRDLLLERWCGRVVSLSAPQVRDAPLSDPDREPWLVIADASTDADLDALAGRLYGLDLDRLLCGAGGLAAAWARVLIPEPRPLPPLEPVTRPVWVLAGSQHRATRGQMEALSGLPGSHVEWIEAGTDRAASRLTGLLECSTVGFALTSDSWSAADRAWAEAFIAAAVAEARRRGAAAFVATGGETAALLLRAMGASALEIDRELLPGIPLCRMADGPWIGTPLVTKAGGFGERDTLARAIGVLRSG
jgi:uncharacterized protein YgbK (DUF1537 family)